jgi:hypothetical protein
MPTQILAKGFQTIKCFLEEKYRYCTMPCTYKTITKIFLKLTPAPKECMSYVLSNNFIYNKKCNIDIVINNNNNFVLPCVWL